MTTESLIDPRQGPHARGKVPGVFSLTQNRFPDDGGQGLVGLLHKLSTGIPARSWMRPGSTITTPGSTIPSSAASSARIRWYPTHQIPKISTGTATCGITRSDLRMLPVIKSISAAVTCWKLLQSMFVGTVSLTTYRPALLPINFLSVSRRMEEGPTSRSRRGPVCGTPTSAWSGSASNR